MRPTKPSTSAGIPLDRHADEQRRSALNIMEDAVRARRDLEQLNADLRISEGRFRTLFELGPVAVYSCDASGVIREFNRRAAELWGRAPLLGDTDERFCGSFKMIRPDGSVLAHEHCPMSEVLSGIVPDARDAEVGIERPDGSRITVVVNIRPIKDERGAITGAINCFYDITQRKRMEQALRESEIRYRRLFETAHDGVLILDAETARIADANPYIAELLGYPPGELLGKELWELGFFKDAETNKAAVRELQSTHYIRYDDLPLESKTGKRIEVEFVSNLYDEGDHLVIQCNIRDVTEHKHLEADLQNRNEQLAVADSSKTQFIAMLSHELRSPLNAIRGWIQILMRPDTREADRRTGLEVIERSSRMQAELISDLLDVHRIAAGKLRLEIAPVDLREVVDRAIDTIAPAAAAKGIQLDRELDPTPALMSGDASRLQQVFGNVLGNAIKFTGNGGRVRVALRLLGAQAEVVVSDTGRGISAAALPHCFERFRQADPLTSRYEGGLGLGLAIAKQLLDLHGGAISAQSAGTGKGATFTVTLPFSVIGAVRPAVRSESKSVDPVSLGGVLVLLVDDDIDAREPLRRVLEAAGAETIVVASADEALDRIGARRPDVIVSDIAMPGRDGYELIRSVRALPPAQGSRVPAIALTAYAATEDRERALSAGFQKHMTKPVEEGDLVAAVAALAHPRTPEPAPLP